jgi:hypothetical protein
MTKPTIQMIVDRCHPDDRMRLQQVLERAAMEKIDFTSWGPMVPSNLFLLLLVSQRAEIRRVGSTLGLSLISPSASALKGT